jgi:hypothetical protein
MGLQPASPMPPKHKKYCVHVLHLRSTKMHYMTRISHQIQKHNFNVKSTDARFIVSTPGPPEHEKYCVDVLHPGRPNTHYVTHRSHRMQKHKLS